MSSLPRILCRQGHEYAIHGVKWKGDSGRRCLACATIYQQRHRRRIKTGEIGTNRVNGTCSAANIDAARAIIKELIEAFDISVANFYGPNRKGIVVWLRQVAIYIVRKETGMGLVPLGYLFRRDHSTIHHSLGVVQVRIDRSPTFAGMIGELRRRMGPLESYELVSEMVA